MHNSLLTADFVRELEVLRRRLDIKARSASMGEHAAKRKGGSAEFQEHRAYAPGDDMRRIDWAAYARTNEPVLKLFRSEEDVICRILCDTSLSMTLGDQSKFHTAQKLAAAIGYMTLVQSERVQLYAVSDGIDSEQLPMRGRAKVAALIQSILAIKPHKNTHLAKAIESVIQRSRRPGMLVVLSDFFDPSDVTHAFSKARASGHDVFIVHIVTPEDVDPQFEGDWMLEDAETGQTVEVTMDHEALQAYFSRFMGLCERLQQWAKTNGGTYVRTRTDESLETAVRRFVARSVD